MCEHCVDLEPRWETKTYYEARHYAGELLRMTQTGVLRVIEGGDDLFTLRHHEVLPDVVAIVVECPGCGDQFVLGGRVPELRWRPHVKFDQD